jgi:thioredoxin 1
MMLWVHSALSRVALAAVIAAAAMVFGCTGASEKDASSDKTSATDTSVGSTIETDGVPVLLDLGSDSCVACKTMAPILDGLREEFDGRLTVRFIDVRKVRGAADEFGVRIIPTQIFFDAAGRELFRHQGFLSRDDILSKWAELGYAFGDATEGA